MHLVRPLFITFFLALSTMVFASDKIALLFLTYDDLNHSELWKELLEKAPNKYNIYIHSKKKLNDPFFRQFRIHHIVPTSWSVHVKAWQELVKEAMKDKENSKFIFLSGSCIPLYSLDYIYKTIISDPKSHMYFARPWWPEQSSREVHLIDRKHRYGNYEWVILNRKHAEIVAQDRSIIHVISQYPHDQESYFATLFSIHGCLDEEMRDRTYTYMNWTHSPNGGASPYQFNQIDPLSDSLLQEAYQGDFLFARKFGRSYPGSELMRMIRAHKRH